MTLTIPDISHHQAGIDIQALKNQGAAALIARVGQGAGRRTDGREYGTTQDREWARHRDEARRVGLPLIAYWYVGNKLTAAQNADLAKAWVGDTTIPWMIDFEDASGDGAMYCATVAAFRARGLRVILGYVPNWYWAGAMKKADLSCGPQLVNSRYSTASGTPSQIYKVAGGDGGNGWINYGNQTTAMWQFTNKAQMAGRAIDCSAYRGNLTQLLDLINGSENDMQPSDLVIDPATGQPALDTNGNPYNYGQAWYYTNLSGWVLREGLDELKTQQAATLAAIAALANDQDITPDQLAQVMNQAIAEHMPTAEQVAAAQRDQLAEIIREVVPDEFADQVVQRLGEKLAPSGGAVIVPNLIGLTGEAARDVAHGAGIRQLTLNPGTTNDVAELNKVIAQTPTAGASSTTVAVTVAKTLNPTS